MKHFLIAVSLFLSIYAFADTYTCEKNGSRLLQGAPCPQGYETISLYREDKTLLEKRRRDEKAAFGAMMKRYDAVNKSQSARMSREAAVHGAALAEEQARQDAIQREKERYYESDDSGEDIESLQIGVDGRSIPSQVPRPAAPQTPVMTKCYNGNCYDNSGLRYNQQGSGFVRSDGRYCKQFGSQVECF